MPQTVKPFASAKTLKLKVKGIKEEINMANTVLKLCEQESARVESNIEHQNKDNADLELLNGISSDADLQMLRWELSDNVELSAIIKSELATRALEEKTRKEQLEKDLADAEKDLRYFSMPGRLARFIKTIVNVLCKHFSFFNTIRDDFTGCLKSIKNFREYAGFGAFLAALASVILTAIFALSGSIGVGLLPAVLLTICYVSTMWGIAKDSGRPGGISLPAIAMLFPLVFRVLPVALSAYVVAFSMAPPLALGYQVDNYFRATAVPVSHYWVAHFSALDTDGDGVATTKELAALRTKLEARQPVRVTTWHSPEGQREVERMKVLDATSGKNMLEHLQLHWEKIGHPIVYKQDPNSKGEFIPQEYAVSKDDLKTIIEGQPLQTTP